LSCGCGDYALLFIARIAPRGFMTLLVDGVELSSETLQNHFSGHAVVAIRCRPSLLSYFERTIRSNERRESE